jgi:hypothetical protein
MVMDANWSGWIVVTEKDSSLIVRVRMMLDPPFIREMQMCPRGENWVSFYLEQNDELSLFRERLANGWRL